MSISTIDIAKAVAAVPLTWGMTSSDHRERNLKISALNAQWAEFLAEEYAYDLPVSLHANLFEKAWEEGHSSGYDSVESCYEDYAAFARKVITAHSAELAAQ